MAVGISRRPTKASDKFVYVMSTDTGEKIALVPRGIRPPEDCGRAIRVEDCTSEDSAIASLSKSSARWVAPKANARALPSHAEVRAQWPDPFMPPMERYDGEALVRPGLRPPQIGALQAVLAHWTASAEPVTVVMPTGSGKTDTMVALLVAAQIRGLLVMVPGDPLRAQTAAKFKSLGILRKLGLISATAPLPVVATMRSAPRTIEEIDALCEAAQVIVATDAALQGMPDELQDGLAKRLSHFFVDEAHHIGAASWKAIKQRFLNNKRPIVQFTATPFRNDGRRVDGRHVYTYPLRRAQQDRLFTPVTYEPVHALSRDRADDTIVQKVGLALDRDLATGLDHLALARCASIDRAREVLHLYRTKLARHPAEMVHNRTPRAERQQVIERLRSGSVRIVVCVNMLGEGFDLPRLKIAALHDPQHSEAPTLQFIGRFTRAEKGLGNATVIAPVAGQSEKAWLNQLYRSDADWNQLLRRASGHLTESQRRREDLFADMVGSFETIPIETITPKYGCWIFKLTNDNWDPEKLDALDKGRVALIEGPTVNHERSLAMAVVRVEDALDWTRTRHPVDVAYRLVMVHYHEDLKLLYVSASGDDKLAARVAQLVGGDSAAPVGGEAVFRVLHGMRRAMLTSLGVKETEVKPVRFQMSSGIDIVPQLDALTENRSRVKTNLFALGYVEEPVLDAEVTGETQSVQQGIGCSIKGKIWAPDRCSNPGEWIDWCRRYGSKVSDASIGTAAIMRGILRPVRQQSRPAGRVPISVDWPDAWLDRNEDRIAIVFEEDHEVPFLECELVIAEHSGSGPIHLAVRGGAKEAGISYDVVSGVAKFDCPDWLRVRFGSRDEMFKAALVQSPPSVRFTDGSFMQGAELAELTEMENTDFDPLTIEAIDWRGIDLKAESQGLSRNACSVQGHVIRKLIGAAQAPDVVFDGDVSGEIADIVTLRRQGRVLDVHLYHCKYMLGEAPGARVGELYEVCGQAMKSVRWASPDSTFLRRMLMQEDRRLAAGGPSRFERGGRYQIESWLAERDEYRTKFNVTIVQPGYSRAKADRAHMPVIGALKSYLMATYGIGLSVWTSA